MVSSRDKNDPGLPGEAGEEGKGTVGAEASLPAFSSGRVQSFRVSQSSATEVRIRCESGGEGAAGEREEP